jgi:hypothetical protein
VAATAEFEAVEASEEALEEDEAVALLFLLVLVTDAASVDGKAREASNPPVSPTAAAALTTPVIVRARAAGCGRRVRAGGRGVGLSIGSMVIMIGAEPPNRLGTAFDPPPTSPRQTTELGLIDVR